jgi:PAS domain S-box-containing protein
MDPLMEIDYPELFDNVPQGVIVIRRSGEIQLVNAAIERLFGYHRSELIGRPVEVLILKKSPGRRRRHLKAYFGNPQSGPAGTGFELAGRRKDGRTFPIEIGISIVGTGRNRLAIGVVSDITDRKRLDAAVRTREQEMKTLLDNVPDAIVRFDRRFRYQYVNTVVEKISGIPAGAFLGKTPRQLGMPQTLIEVWSKAIRRVFRTGKLIALEFAYPGPNGITEWEARDIPEFAADGSVQSVLCVMRDITEEKRLERTATAQEKEMQSLAGQLMTAQEEERRRVSRELHDRICQDLASLAIDMGKVAEDLPPAQKERAQIKSLQGRMARTSEQARHLAYELHSSVLDDLGLAAALRFLCVEFSAKAKLEIEFVATRVPDTLPREISTCIYRVAQEALQNASKHSMASSIWVGLTRRGVTINLWVEDNGVGFNPEHLRGRARLGLISMQERARMVGGKLSVDSRLKRGTQVFLEIPLTQGDYETGSNSSGRRSLAHPRRHPHRA